MIQISFLFFGGFLFFLCFVMQKKRKFFLPLVKELFKEDVLKLLHTFSVLYLVLGIACLIAIFLNSFWIYVGLLIFAFILSTVFSFLYGIYLGK
jgi:hypothetical protein